MNRQISERIAEQYGTDVDTVEKEIGEAIRFAAEKPSPLWIELFGIGHIPSSEEFCEKVKIRIQTCS